MRRQILGCLTAIACALAATSARADKVILQDGRELDGRVTLLNSMLTDPNDSASVMPQGKPIVMCDNDLSYTYVTQKFVTAAQPAPVNDRLEEINVWQPVATAGSKISAIGGIINIQPWKNDGFGRRIFSMAGGPTGRIDVVQGITKLTPVWSEVQGLQVKQSYIWDMRIATSSLDRDVLSKIIKHNIDPKNADDRLKVVRFYLQAERYQDATAELNQIISEFPGRAGLQEVAHDLKQMGARQIVKEIDTRRQAGQHQFAYHLLETFPAEGVDGEILQQVRAKLDDYSELKKQGDGIVAKLNELAEKLPDGSLRKRVEPIVKEIDNELSVGTLDRMATYRRFADDPDSKPEAKLSLAISGWLVGAADATENLQIALSMVDLRDLLHEYLKEDGKLKRDAILSQIRGQEAAAPKLIASLADHMKPPVDTEPQADPGFYKLTIPGLPNDTPVTYFVQLPPEYDPHQRYPCVVTLNGSGTTAEQQVAWWAGDFIERDGHKIRTGQASRHGYIVVAPVWTVEHQTQFEGTAREHDAVLSVLRDACRRFAIDTDRVFLSGHSVGATAAWEIGLAHPDLWAGVIPIVPTVNKMIELYWKNAERVPLYFVCGEMDGDKFVNDAKQFDRYFGQAKAMAFDCTVVEFRGRGHEHFSDEIQRLFDWMGQTAELFPARFHHADAAAVRQLFLVRRAARLSTRAAADGSQSLADRRERRQCPGRRKRNGLALARDAHRFLPAGVGESERSGNGAADQNPAELGSAAGRFTNPRRSKTSVLDEGRVKFEGGEGKAEPSACGLAWATQRECRLTKRRPVQRGRVSIRAIQLFVGRDDRRFAEHEAHRHPTVVGAGDEGAGRAEVATHRVELWQFSAVNFLFANGPFLAFAPQ